MSELRVADVFPRTNHPEHIYQSRVTYEQEVASRLTDDPALILFGRSGYGKTSIAVEVMRVQNWSYVIVQCPKNASLELLTDKFEEAVLDRNKNKIWIGPLKFLKRIRHLTVGGVGADTKEQDPLSRFDALLRNSYKKKYTVIFERMELVLQETRAQMVAIFNHLADVNGYDRWPKILCLSIWDIKSPPDTGQEDRFDNLQVGPFEEEQLRQQIRAGLEVLGVKMSPRIEGTIVRASRGSPLACSNIMRTALQLAQIGSVADVTNNSSLKKFQIKSAIKQLSDTHKEATQDCLKKLDEGSAFDWHVLRAIVSTGHVGSLTQVRSELPMKEINSKDVLARIRASIRSPEGSWSRVPSLPSV